MGRNGASFERGKPRFKTQPIVLVICEDSKSSLKYINDAKAALRVIADVEVVHAGKTNPLGIIRHAIERRNKYNVVYCAIDRDTHEDFDEALALAEIYKEIEVIASYPCFEYWLLLHFKYSRKAYSRAGNRSPGEQMVRALRECPGMANYDKGGSLNVFELLKTELPTARRNAERALAAALDEQEFNPSTTLHLLISAFEGLAKPTLI